VGPPASWSATSASPEVTGALITALPAAYRAGANEVFLTALVLALRCWQRDRGLRATEASTITMESHGREQLAPGVDLSRTVGWFTREYPVRVPADAVRSEDYLADALAVAPPRGACCGR
jgi:hypothetical protein